ncbi:GNAT family N-acetyltransferase [Chamaesiphon sp. GL140_3_metabinner_50]|uniref:GNAT family N-acetyltransferase n=1 Tax=Chamaesiphon sp. GL140_3_metabinner_50 TaxID=2970812 RepID=UPI0025DF5DC3|nr:GNAT family N-acetyltransferase [Chamaesiphon sp. GL140_3_metabinner_50]
MAQRQCLLKIEDEIVMQLHKFDSIDKFWNKTQTYLLQNEAENNLLLAVVNTLLHNPERYLDPPYLAMVEIDGEVVVAAIRTPPRKLLLSKASYLESLTLVAQDLCREALTGVMGLVPELETFLQEWQGLTAQSYRLLTEMRIHQLTALQPSIAANGHLRLVTEKDRALLIEWLPAFDAETGLEVIEDVERIVTNRLNKQDTYLWEDNNVPVSLAAGMQFSPAAARIGSVYTPPEYRRKGYATACVAALSQQLLDEGCDRCFLLTDLANPTSNHIYRQIGYVPVCDWHEYSILSQDPA